MAVVEAMVGGFHLDFVKAARLGWICECGDAKKIGQGRGLSITRELPATARDSLSPDPLRVVRVAVASPWNDAACG